MKKLKNRNIFILLTIILSLGITLGAVYFMYQYKDSRENELSTGMISLNFTEKSEVINLTSNVPMIDDLGLKSRPYEFTITNTSTVPVKADITLDIDNDTTIKYGAVRYALFIDDEKVIKDYVHRDNLTLYEVDELQPSEVINCKLYFWIDYYYDYPGEIFKAKIKAVGESIDELQQEAITVTFDADGGVLDTTTKEVYYHGYYGELPTPTKEGYTFMGWNGKNMFDEESILMAIKGATHENGYYIFDTYYARNEYGADNNQLPIYNFKENTIYAITIYGYVSKSYLDILFHYTDSTKLSKKFDLTVYGKKSFLSTGNTIEKIRFSYGIRATAYISHIQLEESDMATEYEPYYITSDTKVVQNGNHTLKAIWKENS